MCQKVCRASHTGTDSWVAEALIALRYQVPASVGPVKGGEGLLTPFPHEPLEQPITVVIDPATALLRSETNAKATTTAAWTNQLPKIIPLPPKTACGGM